MGTYLHVSSSAYELRNNSNGILNFKVLTRCNVRTRFGSRVSPAADAKSQLWF